MTSAQNTMLKTLLSGLISLSLRTMSLFAHTAGAWFNPFLLITPCLGLFLGVSELVAGHFIVASIWAAIFPLSFITVLQLPTLAATLFAYHSNQNSNTSKIVIAGGVLMCTVLFIAHPVGNSAIYYPLLWLPILGTLFTNSLFIRSWGITLSAHAVGTLIYLYTHTTTALFWAQLMPLAFVERFCSSLVIYLVLTGIQYGVKYAAKSTLALQAQA